VVSRKERQLAEIEGNMIFNRKNYGMNKGIPFVKIGDHVEVDFHLIVRHFGGPPRGPEVLTGLSHAIHRDSLPSPPSAQNLSPRRAYVKTSGRTPSPGS
jgi:hypothetical protein